jgi:hypothetical protein
MRLKLLSCEVLYREMCDVVAHSPHQVDLEFLAKGRHDLGAEGMRQALQAAVDRMDGSGFDAVLLGYALCGNGLAGVTARSLPLVIPRAHDCIALLMGSRERYQQYFDDNPGTYFRSTGWLERGGNLEQLSGYVLTDLTSKYGEESGRYLYEQLTSYRRSYRQLAYIRTGIEGDTSFEERARAEAASRGWEFNVIDGHLNLFRRLVSGDWSAEDFLVVLPGYCVAATYDDAVVAAERISP